MSREFQSEYARAGAGDRTGIMNVWSKQVPMVMVAGATVAVAFQIPIGAVLHSYASDVPVAFTGAPTNINLSIGTAAAGAQIVAATDIKAQAHTSLTPVAAFDNVGYAAAATQTVYLTLAAVGGTAPAGTANVRVTYAIASE